jgi:hypothetical protein
MLSRLHAKVSDVIAPRNGPRRAGGALLDVSVRSGGWVESEPRLTHHRQVARPIRTRTAGALLLTFRIVWIDCPYSDNFSERALFSS